MTIDVIRPSGPLAQHARAILDQLGAAKAAAYAARQLFVREERARHQRPGGLMAFVRYFWDVLEPDTEFSEGWALDSMALHLEAVADGRITRLLINVPPGSCKSLMTSVFFPAWIWAAAPTKGPGGRKAKKKHGRPGCRFLALSYAAALTERDNRRMLLLIQSDKFQEMYGQRFDMVKSGEELLANNKTGFKQASSVRGTVTGARADIVILDDPNSIKEIESQVIRAETGRFFKEALSNRLNHMVKSAIIVVQQRSHEEDVSGVILSEGMPYEHLCIPLLAEVGRVPPTCIGWQDPREEDDECFWPERFPPEAIAEAQAMGDFAFAGQYQQRPEPRGGGIFKREYWNIWDPEDGRYPEFDFIVASLDPAYTTKQQNDPSGFVILGVNYDPIDGCRVFLISAWAKRLVLHGPTMPRLSGESEHAWSLRTQPTWGLVQWLAWSCRRFAVDVLLVESKASGLTVVQELERLMLHREFGIEVINPGLADKETRAHRVQHLLAASMLYCPDRPWAQAVIDECATFPRGAHDDRVDALTQGLWWLRQTGKLAHRVETAAAERAAAQHRTDQGPLYPV